MAISPSSYSGKTRRCRSPTFCATSTTNYSTPRSSTGSFQARDPRRRLTEDMTQKGTQPAVKNEADNGLKNERGTLSWRARTTSTARPRTFFRQFEGQRFLDHSRGNFGYAGVRGAVTEGLDVIDKDRRGRDRRRRGSTMFRSTPVIMKRCARIPANASGGAERSLVGRTDTGDRVVVVSVVAASVTSRWRRCVGSIRLTAFMGRGAAAARWSNRDDNYVYSHVGRLDRISPNLPLAVGAAESEVFPEHWGFDVPAIEKPTRSTNTANGARRRTIASKSPRISFCGRTKLFSQGAFEGLFHAVLIEALWPKRQYWKVI